MFTSIFKSTLRKKSLIHDYTSIFFSICIIKLVAKPRLRGVTVLSQLLLCMIRFQYILARRFQFFFQFSKYYFLETSQEKKGFETTEKKGGQTDRQTVRHFRIYNSRD